MCVCVYEKFISKSVHAVKSFTELGPLLLQKGVKYLLSDVFNQDPFEKYFCGQRHCGGGSDNPTIDAYFTNMGTLVQQNCIYKYLRTMNVESHSTPLDVDIVRQPLPKHKRMHNKCKR